MGPPTLDRTSRRCLQALLVAVLAFSVANAWVGARLDVVLEDAFVRQYLVLDRRVAAYPARSRVKVLLLGNSHVYRGLVPPFLAHELGLAEDEVFSLAVPATTAFHYRLLLERHLAAFPGVRLVVAGADEVGLLSKHDLADRWLTRGSLPMRLHYAARYPASWRETLSVTASWAVPVAEYGPLLRETLAQQRTRALRRLLLGESHMTPVQRAFEGTWFPWGYPLDMANWPPKVDPTLLQRHRATVRAGQLARANAMVHEASHLGRGCDELATMATDLAGRGIRTAFLRVPFEAGYEDVIARTPGYATLRTAMVDRVSAIGPYVWPQVRWTAPRWFMDSNHLNLYGARRFAGLVAAELRRAGLAPQADQDAR